MLLYCRFSQRLALLRFYHFFASASFRIWLSRLSSAYICFRFRFSASKSCKRLISAACILHSVLSTCRRLIPIVDYELEALLARRFLGASCRSLPLLLNGSLSGKPTIWLTSESISDIMRGLLNNYEVHIFILKELPL